jgi:hypothetical protein
VERAQIGRRCSTGSNHGSMHVWWIRCLVSVDQSERKRSFLPAVCGAVT